MSKLQYPLIILLIIATMISSCGMPTEAYLYPPVRRTDLNLESSKMYFLNTAENDADIFSGFLFFYKFYDSEQDHEYLEDYGETFFTAANLNLYDVSQERGIVNYVTLFEVLDVPPEDEEVFLDFSSVATSGATGYYPSISPAINFTLERSFQRQSDDNQWNKIGFSNYTGDYEDGDSDLSMIVSTGSSLTCAVWVVAYGFDINETFKNVYSEGEYIGQFTIDNWDN